MRSAEGHTEFALKVQLLNSVRDRVLALGQLAGLRNGDGWFTPGDVAGLFESLRLPQPGNVSENLSRLEKGGSVRRRSSGGWSLTPVGRSDASRLVGEIDPAAIAAEVIVGGSTFARANWPLIPPEFAPQQWVQPIRTMNARYPFATNVFCMTRYSSSEEDLVSSLVPTLRAAMEHHGLTLHLAADRKIVDDLWSNVAAHMWACKYGIAIFEMGGGALNQNLLIEAGAMLATGRRCLLLKGLEVEMPSDFIGQIYDEVDLADLDASEK